MACATRCTASPCPKTTRFSDSSSVRSRSRSEDDAWRAGMRAMRATTDSISAGVITIGSGGPGVRGSEVLGFWGSEVLRFRYRRLAQTHHGTRFVNDVDGAIRQLEVAEVARGK